MDEKKRILVVAAHPDDEVLGCGGTIARHTAQGDQVWSLIACEGESARNETRDHASQTEQARQILGVAQVHHLGFPDQRLDTLPLLDVIQALERITTEFKPHTIYTHHHGDINRDHQILHEAVMVATRPNQPWVEGVYAFDTASSTEWGYPRTFIPDTWIDISQTLETKLEAMAAYTSELCEYPHPRSLKALRHKAHAWGNQACMDAAEAFMTLRRLVRDRQTLL